MLHGIDVVARADNLDSNWKIEGEAKVRMDVLFSIWIDLNKNVSHSLPVQSSWIPLIDYLCVF